MGCIWHHKSTDRYEGPHFVHTLEKKYDFIKWRAETFPNCGYAEVDFDLEWWKENYRDVYYKFYPDIEWVEGIVAPPKSDPAKPTKQPLPGAGRPKRKIVIDGKVYDSIVEAGEAYGIKDYIVRNRCASTAKKWSKWCFADEV